MVVFFLAQIFIKSSVATQIPENSIIHGSQQPLIGYVVFIPFLYLRIGSSKSIKRKHVMDDVIFHNALKSVD